MVHSLSLPFSDRRIRNRGTHHLASAVGQEHRLSCLDDVSRGILVATGVGLLLTAPCRYARCVGICASSRAPSVADGLDTRCLELGSVTRHVRKLCDCCTHSWPEAVKGVEDGIEDSRVSSLNVPCCLCLWELREEEEACCHRAAKHEHTTVDWSHCGGCMR